MTEEEQRRPARNATANSPAGHSTRGSGASWADVDRGLEVRERLAAIVDALDADDLVTARLNARWLLEDLDESLR